MNTTNRYRYELPPRATALGILFYLGLSAWMVYLAWGSAEMPRLGLIALSVIFATLALVVLVRRLAFPRTLELTDDAILLPRGLPWPRITTICYADIISIKDSGDTLTVATGSGSFWVGAIRFEGYGAVRKIISDKTAIALEPLDRTKIGPNLDSEELPRPLVHWVQPEDWPRFRMRAEISRPVLYQLRTELWFFVRCYAYCCAFIVLPFLGFVILAWLYLPFDLVAVFISSFCAPSALAIMFTMLHWLDGIYPVPPETKISFRDRGVTEQLPNGQQASWNYRQFYSWAVIERQFKGHILQILLLNWQVKGRTATLAMALPDASVRDLVVQILNDRHVPQAPDTKPSWEVR